VDVVGGNLAVRGEAPVLEDAVSVVDGGDLAEVISAGGAVVAAVARTVGVHGDLVALL